MTTLQQQLTGCSVAEIRNAEHCTELRMLVQLTKYTCSVAAVEGVADVHFQQCPLPVLVGEDVL